MCLCRAICFEAPSNSNFFSISLEGSSFRESTVFRNIYSSPYQIFRSRKVRIRTPISECALAYRARSHIIELKRGCSQSIYDQDTVVLFLLPSSCLNSLSSSFFKYPFPRGTNKDNFLVSPRTSINYLLMNLAIADMTVATFLAPRYIFIHTFIHPDGVAGNILCRLLTGGNFAWVGAGASVFTLVTIATERYFAVMYPFENKGKLSSRKLKVRKRVILFQFNFHTQKYQYRREFCLDWRWHISFYTCCRSN